METPIIGDRLSYDGAVCTVRYVGEVAGTAGLWIGVEWDDATRGKHDGSHKGTRYFTCKSKSPSSASFVRPARPAAPPCSFIAGLRAKYTAESATAGDTTGQHQIRFSGKVAEEVGFEKIRRQQADLGELRFTILDGSCIARAYDDEISETRGHGVDRRDRVAEVCPKAIEVDLSRNLFTHVGAVVEICKELPALRSLRLNGNRFQDILHDERLRDCGDAFRNVRDLALEETLMTWEEIMHIAAKFPSLATLSAAANQFSSLDLSPTVSLSTLPSTLTSLNLEFNEFETVADAPSLSELKALRNLHLKGNNIRGLVKNRGDSLPIFPASLQYLDVSYNRIASWDFIDDLSTCFPALTSLRFAHNPIYDDPDPEFPSLSSASSSNAKTASPAAAATEEAYMMTIGRLANLKTLNFSTIIPKDREDAEMWYLARIAKHMTAVPEGSKDEKAIATRHPRFADLCALYGAPVVVRRQEVNPAFLEARLVNVTFSMQQVGQGSDKETTTVVRKARIPKSFDMYRVKGIAGRLLGRDVVGLRLIWETGEWDPVAGFDDEVEDSSGDEGGGSLDEGGEVAPEGIVGAGAGAGLSLTQADKRAGRWVKRELELRDGPRLLGFCVDGLEANIRVEDG